MKGQEKLLLIDGNALVHRSYHALPPLSHQGEPTNAVYGFTSVLLKVVRELKPDYVVATFDLAAPTFRHEEFPEYKAHRPKTPDDLISQFDKVKDVVRAFSIPLYEKEGFEADDLIGTIAKKVSSAQHKVQTLILTGDLDTLQLVDDSTKVVTLKKGISDTTVYDARAVRDRFGVDPVEMPDFKGLKGDPSDNIPGVPGVGDKTASELLGRYGTVENLFSHLEELPEKTRKKLEGRRDEALFSKSLATIRCDVPLELDLETARFGGFDKDRVEALFKKLGFFTLVSRLHFKDGKAPTHETGALSSGEKTPQEAGARDTKELEGAGELAVWWDGAEFTAAAKSGVPRSFPLPEAKDFLENEKVPKIGYDLKQIEKACLGAGIAPKGFVFDALIAAYLLFPGERQYPLHRILLEQETEGEPPSVFFALKEKLEDKLRQEGLWKVYHEIEMPLIPVLARMERAGILVDTQKLHVLSEKLEREKTLARQAAWKLAGREFNLDSPAQLSQVLFVELGIKKEGRMKKTKTGMMTTKAEELEKMKGAHPIIPEILRWRELAKLKGTYADAFAQAVGEDGRIHTTLSQTGTATGRLSSSEPNLQTIPQRGELAREIRAAFVAPEGHSFMAFDLSQIELRIIASLSGDEKMIHIFREGGDIHRATASEVNHVPPEQVTPQMRYAAKELNFGILYGMGARAFAGASGIDQETARKFIEEYFRDFSGVARFIETTKKNAQKHGFVQTLSGRKRWLPDIRSKNPMLRASAERMAQNMPIQGLQADIIKIAMVRVAKEVLALPRFAEGARMVLQIHDELLFEVRDSILKEMVDKVRAIMESAWPLKVPIVVGVSQGKNLAQMQRV